MPARPVQYIVIGPNTSVSVDAVLKPYSAYVKDKPLIRAVGATLAEALGNLLATSQATIFESFGPMWITGPFGTRKDAMQLDRLALGLLAITCSELFNLAIEQRGK